MRVFKEFRFLQKNEATDEDTTVRNRSEKKVALRGKNEGVKTTNPPQQGDEE